jgi:hypothetical protein
MVGRILGERDWASDAARGLVRALLEGRRPPAQGAGRSAASAPSRRLVQLASAITPGDPAWIELLDEALSSLKERDELVILFDGPSVGALRMNARTEKTPLESATFTQRERRAAAKRLGLSYATAPRNPLEYIQQLARAGAKVFIHRSAIRLYGLSDEEIHPVAKPVSTRQVERIIDESDACYSYSRR